ncbi:hypothetical protein F01_50173 [Burkholderia cenocepacia]|nr:hypothetical protein F01_50173 [Burkholderia cenocepacia]
MQCISIGKGLYEYTVARRRRNRRVVGGRLGRTIVPRFEFTMLSSLSGQLAGPANPDRRG